mmetsp:Transcript_101943/g.287727  ORF Transcript_101943/g.287727 Transcript_101943/m.287727 type:complete len:489 (+) Transcript_101943:58-1524(+)
MMLALEWYKHTPLPDSSPKARELPSTELSQRLAAAFDAGLHCDVAVQVGANGACCVAAHRAVLRRNPALSFDVGGDNAADGMPRLMAPAGLSLETLRRTLRAHYCESEVDPDADCEAEVEVTAKRPRGGDATAGLGAGWHSTNTAAVSAFIAARTRATPVEQALIDEFFGPSERAAWLPLHIAVQTELFADCALELSGGTRLPAHRFVVAGVDDGHFFAAALRWPGSNAVVALPEGLSSEAMQALLRLRYGAAATDDVDRILEMRHFAQLFDWHYAHERCAQALEALLVDAGTLDAESLLSVVTHAEEHVGMPTRLRAAALAAAVRQWSRVTEAAETALPASRCAELRALSRVRQRDGHVCDDLAEYLHAAADDLTEWERDLALEAPLAARKKVFDAWEHWYQILFEFGHIAGADAVEQWRAKVRAQRETLREVRSKAKAAQLNLPPGRVWFDATRDWHEVPPNAVCPGGLEYRCDMQTGRNYARVPA